ncbi:MAG: hypothetical protein AAF085_17660 [Planctomycetota bacterium]
MLIPRTVHTVAEELHTLLKGDALADQASEVITAIRKDKPLFDAVRATIALRGVLAEAESIGLDQDNAVAEDKANARSMRLISRDLDRLIKAYPDTEAGMQAKALWDQWELGE